LELCYLETLKKIKLKIFCYQEQKQSSFESFGLNILLSNIYNGIEHKFYNLYKVLSSFIHT
jgi:hypothetical protein